MSSDSRLPYQNTPVNLEDCLEIILSLATIKIWFNKAKLIKHVIALNTFVLQWNQDIRYQPKAMKFYIKVNVSTFNGWIWFMSQISLDMSNRRLMIVIVVFDSLVIKQKTCSTTFALSLTFHREAFSMHNEHRKLNRQTVTSKLTIISDELHHILWHNLGDWSNWLPSDILIVM